MMIAEESILKKHDVDTIPGGIITNNKWAFHTNKSTICSENGLNAIAKRISKSIHNNDEDEYINRVDDRIELYGALLHLPCMIFNKNIISITTPNGMKISLVAEDALKLWVLEHLRCRESGDEINTVSVPFAWNKNNKGDKSGNSDKGESKQNNEIKENEIDAQQTHWDWTFSCTDYCGTIAVPSKDSPSGYKQYITSARYISNAPTTKPSMINSIFPFISSNTNTNTSSTSTITSTTTTTNSKYNASHPNPTDPSPNPTLLQQWETCESSGINKDLLQERDDILFYDDVILYQVC